MKSYLLENNELISNKKNSNIFFLTEEELKNMSEFANHKYLPNSFNAVDSVSKIDFYKDIYYGNLYLSKYLFESNFNLLFIYKNQQLFFIIDNSFNETKLVDIINNELDKYLITIDNMLIIVVLLLNYLISNDVKYANKIQKEIDKLENKLLIDKETNNFNVKLLNIRKQLAKFRKNNNSIAEFIDIVEYQNIFKDGLLQIIKLIDNKNNRLGNDIKVMIEHTIQIKEVYQNQLDVNLNDTMNLFTVISAIFLPLTLITSWYGMNFIAPEFKAEHGYLIPVILSVITLAATIFIIRKYNFLKKK